jgi:hypothetical protein
MDAYLSIPQYRNSNDSEKFTHFTGSIVKVEYPKVIAYSELESGKIFLYDISKLNILLVLPIGIDINIEGKKKTDKLHDTPHGQRSGYLFYKNVQRDVDSLKILFQDSWIKHLVEPLPQIAEMKDPFSLFDGFINHNGLQTSVSLYEYSDKSLAIFTPIPLYDNLKFCKNLVCAKSPSGKLDGFLVFKNDRKHIAFLKNLIPGLDFESAYKKSIPPSSSSSSVSVKQKREPLMIFSKNLIESDLEYLLEVYEYSEDSLALFTTPFQLNSDFMKSDNLTHPTQNSRPGYIIAKKNSRSIEILKTKYNISNLEDLYSMKSSASTIATQGAMQGQSLNPIRSFEDIPFETLIRLIKNNLTNSSGIVSKELIGGNILFYGDEELVKERSNENDEMEISIEIKLPGKLLVLLSPSSI